MKRSLQIFCILFALVLITLQAAAQAEPRITITGADNAAAAYPFSPDAEITVNAVQTATTEGGESTHSCLDPLSTGGHSVWFRSVLPAGTLTLDTTGSTYTTSGPVSVDTVISVYQFIDSAPANFNSFSELHPLSCSDNGTNPGVINNLVINDSTVIYIQVSAAPGVAALDPSSVVLTASFLAATPHPFDEPEQAKFMKFPNLPTLTNIANATVSFDEPADPYQIFLITNTMWAKFTITSKRIIWFQNFYFPTGLLWFSLFTGSSSNLSAAPGVMLTAPDIILAALEPGTYYLRIGLISEPAGTTESFVTFTGVAYLSPIADEFSAGLTEGTAGAATSLEGWSVKNAGTGDGVFCESVSPYDCYYEFESSGADEATKLKANVTLNDVKLKKGDLLLIQAGLGEMVGDPNIKVTLKLKNAAGDTLKYNLSATSSTNYAPKLTVTVPEKFVPVQATTMIKNKDIDPGDTVEIDGLVIVGLRTGEALRTEMLKIPRFGEISEQWTIDTTPKGVLPLPAPAQ